MNRKIRKFITLSTLCCFVLTNLSAQKLIEVKKGEIVSKGQKIAVFDSKGGVLSTNRSLWVLAPGTTDTLVTIRQIYKDFENPLFETGLFYQCNFTDPSKTTQFIPNPPGWGAVGERKIIGLIFNDNNPTLIEGGKISEAGMATFKSQGSFDYDKLLQQAKLVQDKMVELFSQIVPRDKTKPLLQEETSNKTIITRLYVVDQYAPRQRIIVSQDGKKIGIYEKEFVTGSFAKTTYTVYKFVAPFTVDGKEITTLPIAKVEASPGITSAVTPTEIEIKILATGKIIKIPPGPHDMSGTAILKALIDNGLL